MENKVIYATNKKPEEKERRNLSGISLRSENVDYNFGNTGNAHNLGNYNPYTVYNQGEDPLYKQYKNNMMNTIKPNTQRDQVKKTENESNVSEMLIPVKIKSDETDDWTRELKITMIVSFPTPSKQHITINLTDPQDPLFLFILDIDEQEFHFLKQELSLLIEFQHFPQKFFEMLELCANSSANFKDLNDMNLLNSHNNLSNMMNKSFVQSNYISILHHNNSMNEALLIIQEITQFRQLNHLILRFKPATEQNLKKYLSTLVKDFKFKSESLTRENAKLNENLEICHRDLKSFKEELGNIKILHMNDLENSKLDYQKEINDLKEKFFDELKFKLELKETEKINLISDYESKIQELNHKREILTKEKLSLEDLKIKLEASERDLTGKNSIITSELKVYKDEVENLRSTTTNLNQNTFNQEKYLTEFRIKNELILKQIEEKEKNIINLTQLVDNLNKQKSDIEESCRALKNTNNKFEDKLQASISEINKGNEIIQKLQSDLKSQKEKIKLKQQAMKAQELLINQKQNSIDEVIKNLNETKRENEKKEEELKNNKITIENFKLKLEEAEKLCEDNAKVIRFLNQKLNESYQPFRNILKNDMGNANQGIMSGNNNLSVTPLRNKDENILVHNENNKNLDFLNSGSSFNKQPYFNSMAFQSGGSFNPSTNNPINNLQSNNGFVLPETNFGNYKNILTGGGNDNLGSMPKSSTINSVNTNFETTKFNNKFSTINSNPGNTLSKNTNILNHKYGNSNKNYENNYNIQSSDRNSYHNMNLPNETEEEEFPRQAPVSNNNIFQHKILK